jgi:hypothetical protein
MRSALFFRTALVGGLLAGLVCFGYFLVLYGVVPSPLSGKKEPGVVLIWIGMVLAVRYYARHRPGPLHFWEPMGLSLLTALVGGLVHGGLLAGFLSYVDATPLERLVAEARQLVQASAAFSRENFARDSQTLLDYQSLLRSLEEIRPLTLFQDDVVKKLLLSLFPAALIAVYFRRMSQR